MAQPILEKLAQEYEGRMTALLVDVEEQKELAKRYQVMSIPLFIFFKGGQNIEEVKGTTINTEKDLRKAIEAQFFSK